MLQTCIKTQFLWRLLCGSWHRPESWAKYAALAKVEDVSPQDFKHRFGYEMAKRVPLHRLAQIMGHDSLDTTMVYVKGTPGDLQQAVDEVAWA